MVSFDTKFKGLETNPRAPLAPEGEARGELGVHLQKPRRTSPRCSTAAAGKVEEDTENYL